MGTVQVCFVLADGQMRQVRAALGRTLMQVAVDHQIEGIRAECGGQCSCATCHCYVDDAWVHRVPTKQDRETDMIDFVWEPKSNSRLACQVEITAAMEGLTVHVPAQQI